MKIDVGCWGRSGVRGGVAWPSYLRNMMSKIMSAIIQITHGCFVRLKHVIKWWALNPMVSSKETMLNTRVFPSAEIPPPISFDHFVQKRNSSGAYLPIKEVWARVSFVVHQVLGRHRVGVGVRGRWHDWFLLWIALDDDANPLRFRPRRTRAP